MPDFYSVWTDTGLQKVGAAATAGQPFSMPTAVVGDGGGVPVIPNKGMTALVRQVWSGAVGSITRSKSDPNTCVYEFCIPASDGPFTVREVGLKDAAGALCILGNFPETDKPVAANGSVRDMVIRIPVHFENADCVTLVVDSLTIASNEDVDRKIAAHKEDDQAHQDLYLGLNATAVDSAKFEGKTLAQIGMGIPTGCPLPWPTNFAPAGWTFMQGQAFDTELYPSLAAVYPTGVLPDMRGQTIKGTPALGRNVLTTETDGVKSHNHSATALLKDLGTNTSSSTDLGSKTSSYTGEHTHSMAFNYAAGNGGPKPVGFTNVTTAFTAYTGSAGAHTHTTTMGAHTHTTVIGSHDHTVTVASTGNTETTVKNTAFNWIVRLA